MKKSTIDPKRMMRTFLILTVYAYCAFLPAVLAVTPAPDGGYPGANTAEGDDALFSLTTGTDNTAIGFDALFNNADGVWNTATGSSALLSNTSGGGNTAIGWNALYSNTTASSNTAVGAEALTDTTTGYANTATGASALFSNTTGFWNVAYGASTLTDDTTGDSNAALGTAAMEQNTTGARNTAVGTLALDGNSIGNNNTVAGYQAGYVLTGSNNIAVGYQAGLNLTTGNNNIDIGNAGAAGESGIIRIGTKGPQKKTFIAGIYGATASGGLTVFVTSGGQLGTSTSSARFKQRIHDMGDASRVVLSLRPVTFSYKPEIDPAAIPQFGLVAEDVEKIDPQLVVHDENGKPYSVRYEAVNAMLLNEFLKEHRKIEEQDKQIETLTAQLKQQAVLIQKVNDKLEMSRPTPQLVNAGR